MDYKHIEQLLERYWQCETTAEEEEALRRFFCEDDVPAHLMPYKDLFVYQQQQRDVHLDKDFNDRILAQLAQDTPAVKARRMSLRARFMPLFKAAAVVAVIISIGSIMQRSFWTGNEEVIAGDTVSKQISTPSVAQSEERQAYEQTDLDSLKQQTGEQELKENIRQQ